MTEVKIPSDDQIEQESQDPDLKPAKLTWVEDTRGKQGCVLFDGKCYWLVQIDKESGKFYNVSLTPEEWKNRNKEMDERRKK